MKTFQIDTSDGFKIAVTSFGENNATKLFKIFAESKKIKESYIFFECNPEKCKIL